MSLSGLGAEFLAEVVLAVSRIVGLPEAWLQLDGGVRRYRLNRFPYGIVYMHRGEDIIVLGVTHLHRRPENWRTRLKNSER